MYLNKYYNIYKISLDICEIRVGRECIGKFNLFEYSIFFIVSLEGMVIMGNRGLQNNYIRMNMGLMGA